MKMLVNGLRLFVCAAFTMQLMGCGTLLYPERRGQRAGHLDVGVTILDGIGLLFLSSQASLLFALILAMERFICRNTG